MTAHDFLELAEKDWYKANQELQMALGYDKSACVVEPYIDDPANDCRADAELAREVEDKLFEVVTNLDWKITIERVVEYKDAQGKWTGFVHFTMWLNDGTCDYVMTVHSDNLTWLRAAALVELVTEGK